MTCTQGRFGMTVGYDHALSWTSNRSNVLLESAYTICEKFNKYYNFRNYEFHFFNPYTFVFLSKKTPDIWKFH